MTLSECQSLLSFLKSEDDSIQLVGLNMLAADRWRHTGSVATAIYEARVELGYRKKAQKCAEDMDWKRIIRMYYNPKRKGIYSCIYALERVEKQLS